MLTVRPRFSRALVARKTMRPMKKARKIASRVSRVFPSASLPFNKLFGKFPCPPSDKHEFTYTSNVQLTSGATSTFGTEHVYRLNSCYDPDYSIAGHQPYGWDLIMGQKYYAFCVEACTVDISFINTSTSELVVGAQISSSADSAQLQGNSLNLAPERFNVWSQTVPTTGSQRVRIHQTIPTYAVEGVTKDQYMGNFAYWGSAAADASSNSFIRIAVCDFAGDAGGRVLEARVTLTYHTKVFRRVVQPSS